MAEALIEDLILDQVDTAPLDEDDLSDLQKALEKLVSKWKLVGTGFGLKASKLNEIALSHPKDPASCLLDVIIIWLQRNYNTKRFGEPTWKRVVEVVNDSAFGANPALAKSIAKRHKLGVQDSTVELNPPLSARENTGSQQMRPFFVDLRKQLESLNQVQSLSKESKLTSTQEVIQDFVKKSSASGISVDDVKSILATMYEEVLISGDIFKWAQEKAMTMKTSAGPLSSGYVSVTPGDNSPLFCKDTVYHASLCSLAVSTTNSATYKKFFESDYPLHTIEEASISVPKKNVDKYLIARQGSVYYVAFRSEPQLSEWSKHFTSFSEGIHVQSDRIPLRFFIRLMHDGCRIVFTGFSFGGLLAQQVTASLWKSPLLTEDNLKENVSCITFGHPLIHLPLVTEVAEEMPDFKLCLHSFFVEEDIIPSVMRFLNHDIDEKCAKTVLETKELSMSEYKFQGPLTSKIHHQLNEIQCTEEPPSTDMKARSEVLCNLKSLLVKLIPLILAHNGSSYSLVLGGMHIIQVDPLLGLKCTFLQRNEELVTLNLTLIEKLHVDIFMKHNMVEYHQKVAKTYVKQLPMSNCVKVEGLSVVEAVPKAVAFHRYGKEIAVTLSGNNFWFCCDVKVGALKEEVRAADVSEKCIQFHYNPEDKPDISADCNEISVTVFTHFRNAVRKTVQVKHKVYRFTFRQEQLAKLTPSELIEVAFMSSLLEQHPYTPLTPLSQRFEGLHNFFEQVVKIVPVESLLYAISHCSSYELSMQICNALRVTNFTCPLSVERTIAVDQAIHFLVNKGEREGDDTTLQSVLTKQYYKHVRLNREQRRRRYNEIRQHWPQSYKISNAYRQKKCLTAMKANDEEFAANISYLSDLNVRAHGYRSFTQQLCGLTIDHAYSSLTTSALINHPLQTLKEGRQKLLHLAKYTNKDSLQNLTYSDESKKKLSELYNSKMLEVVNTIRNSDLKVCTLLLGAFMVEKMFVPLVKSSLDTAKAIHLVASAAAVGVWALFSVGFGDVRYLLDNISSGSILVDVADYIKGIFKQETVTADKTYAGKLQFMVQGMKETVSCNSHYVSYSLECQLIELCDKLKINEATPLSTLIGNWDTIFKDNVLSFIVPHYQPLVACWLKWALMIHQLREELARYTTVGVVGLVNSGKSLLVSTLFKIKVPVGTTASKRTTIPFLYNLHGCIDGLDVIDFPGVDDRDETIPDLAELLLALSQVVIFVVDYRKVHTESARNWLEMLEEKSVPVLVCLTFGDKLYAEHIGDDGSYPDPRLIKQRMAEEHSMILEQVGHVPSHEVRFFSFCQDKDSMLRNSDEGRRRLKEAGIGNPQDVGDWLAGILESQLDQDDLARRLRSFISA